MRAISAILILFLGLAMRAQAVQPVADHWYVPDDKGRWCAYSSDASYRKAAGDQYENADSHIVAGKLQWLSYLQGSESGDWIVVDEYDFQNSTASGLTRTYSSFANGRVVDTFIAHDGKLVRKSRRYYTLENKPAKPQKGEDYDSHLPVFASVSDMPFYPVIFEKPTSGKVCKPATPDKSAKPRA